MTVCVICYSHRHGTDISVFHTRAGAEKAIRQLMLDWKHELDAKLRRRILRYLREGKLHKAIAVWNSETEEYFGIETTEVLS